MAIEDFHHWTFQVANAFLVISYISWNELYLRFTISAATVFFMLWGIVFWDIALDIVLWNLALFICSTTHIVLIMRKKVVLKFPEEIEILYRTVFQSLMSRYEFKLLYKHCIETQVIKSSGTQIVKSRNELEYLYILGDFNRENTQIELRPWQEGQEQPVMISLSPYMWLGVIDYINMIENLKVDPHSTTFGNITVVASSVKEPVLVFKVDLEALHKLFSNKTHGPNIKNAFYTKMLDFTASYLVSLNYTYIEACGTPKLTENDVRE